MNYRYRRRQRRSFAAVALFALIIAAVIGLVNLAPQILSYFQLTRVTANTPVIVTRTEVASFSPQKPPIQRRGACESPSALAPRADAWRCSVYNETYDPCFSDESFQTVVCGADPLVGIPGFRLDLTKPLPAPPSTETRLKAADLRSIEYRIDLIAKPVRLVNGQFYAPQVNSNKGAVLVALGQMQASGDLDRDGDQDAAVLLVADAGDQGMYIYLAAVANENGKPRNAATVALGDRIQVDNLEIQGGQIVASLKVHSATDPVCCPSQETTQRYNLVGDQLVRWNGAWRLKLANGTACAVTLHETPNGIGRPAYRCSDGRWLEGALLPGQVWYAAPLTTNGAAIDAGDYIPVSELWQ